ncbi:hypothetical protein BKE38_23785 [Pseudoroseomonas deserti]|uniref:HTH araC/xylS-type domain-containing protein n=1 Tax=Teichococcus deserti TaxID=1817963 RepID=A0A1V2GW30_9PROT|nr:AraC family transcriptional regulator [Pseudoroseomonas deserti]ONG47349.1 hypothetical protein BKE38_23785 [Pseudoroseomonas deserti]
MDPLSEVLSLLRPRHHRFGGFTAGGRWGLRFAPYAGIKCYAVAEGACWLALDGEAPRRIAAGDCFLLPRGRGFTIASDLDAEPFQALDLLPQARNGALAALPGGRDFAVMGGHFLVEEAPAAALLGALPAIVHLPGEAERDSLRWSIERLREELAGEQPGGAWLVQQLASMILAQALRRHLAETGARATGWLFALADRPLRLALGALHAAPARRWSLAALAAEAGMSRSAFAVHFRARVGMAPMAYLTRWRMLLAADRLAHSGQPLSEIAAALGYASDSAFAAAFKREMGAPPRRFAAGAPLAAATAPGR